MSHPISIPTAIDRKPARRALAAALLFTLGAGCGSGDAEPGSKGEAGTPGLGGGSAGTGTIAGTAAGGASGGSEATGGSASGSSSQAGSSTQGGSSGSSAAGAGGTSPMGGTGGTGGTSSAGGGGQAGAVSDTWETYAKGFMSMYCVSCHNDDKQGSATRDYHMLSIVKSESSEIACGTSKSMAVWSARGCNGFPPARQFPVGDGPKPTDVDRDRLLRWIDAGSP